MSPHIATRRHTSPPVAPRVAIAPALTVATLFLALLAPVALRAAKDDAEVIVASDRTEAGKNFVPPTAQKPAYFQLSAAGPQELGTIYANDRIPPQKIIEPQLLKALAAQFYFPVDDAHPKPDYVIIYAWGTINPATPGNTDVSDDPTDSASQRHAQRNQLQMLSIVATNKTDFTPRALERDPTLPSLTDGRYFILVAAYDYEAMASGKKPMETMLWRTRLSVYNLIGVSLAAAIPMMLDAAPGAFGADGYPKSVTGKLREGRVDVGEAKVVEYITGTGGASQAPAAPATSAPAPAKPGVRKNGGAK